MRTIKRIAVLISLPLLLLPQPARAGEEGSLRSFFCLTPGSRTSDSRIPCLFNLLVWGQSPGHLDSGKEAGVDLTWAGKSCSSYFRPAVLSLGEDMLPEYIPSQRKKAINKERKKDLKLAKMEFAGLLAFNQASYWIRFFNTVEDWQWNLTWKDQLPRFFSLEAWKFDANCFPKNWTHAAAGAAYYNAFRSNNFSVSKALLAAVLESFYWEYVVEWREVISINDQFFSIAGGISIGEGFYQLTKAINNRKGLLADVLGFLNPAIKLNRWKGSGERRLLRAGEPTDVFGLILEGLSTSGSRIERFAGLRLGFEFGVHYLPLYGKPVNVRRTSSGTLASELSFDILLSQGGYDEYRLFTRSVLLGGFRQSISADNRGYSRIVGLSVAFSLIQRRTEWLDNPCPPQPPPGESAYDTPLEFSDQLAVVHLAGLFFRRTSYAENRLLSVQFEIYPDFALVNSLSLPAYTARFGIDGIKSTLMNHGYYFALGGTVSGEFDIQFRKLYIRGRVGCHFFHSIEGLDRYQRTVDNDFHLRDSRLSGRLELGYRMRNISAEFRLFIERIERKGLIRGFYASNSEIRSGLGLVFLL